MSGLVIGVDAACWANGRGYGRFTREICAAMVALAPQHEFVFFADERAAAEFRLTAPNVRLIRVAQSASPTEAAAAGGNRSVVDMLRFTRAVGREKLDVFFSPSVYTYFPLPLGLRAVVTVHDAIAERFPYFTFPNTRAWLFWRAEVTLALVQARIVLTVSGFAAREIAEVLHVRSSRIRVSLEAPATAYRPSDTSGEIESAARRAGVRRGARWFMYVGGFNPHKHVDLLVRAFAAVAKSSKWPMQLLLVGTVDQDVFHGAQAQIRAVIRELGVESLVVWTGYLPDEELRHLHSGAYALVLPSECEGFGLPAVEAAACGAPVIATTKSPLPELLEGGGLFIKPRGVEELEHAMRRMVDDGPARIAMGRVAIERARALTWPRGAIAALAALQEAAA